MILVYSYSVSADVEGRSSRTFGPFRDKGLAERFAAAGIGGTWSGQERGRMEERRLLCSLEDAIEVIKPTDQELEALGVGQSLLQSVRRARALAKLTAEDRAALNLP